MKVRRPHECLSLLKRPELLIDGRCSNRQRQAYITRAEGLGGGLSLMHLPRGDKEPAHSPCTPLIHFANRFKESGWGCWSGDNILEYSPREGWQHPAREHRPAGRNGCPGGQGQAQRVAPSHLVPASLSGLKVKLVGSPFKMRENVTVATETVGSSASSALCQHTGHTSMSHPEPGHVEGIEKA